jgi:hypothetical protein
MKIKIISFTVLTLIAVFNVGLVFVPAPVSATTTPSDIGYTGLVKCDGVVATDGSEPGRQTRCNFANLVAQMNSLINWMFAIAVPFAVALFAYAGYLYMTGTSGNISKARTVFTTVGIGFGLMLIAWTVIYTILTWLTDGTQGFTSLLK